MTIEANQQACIASPEFGRTPEAEPSEIAVQRAARLLAECPERNWRLHDLADLVYLSTSQLARAFNRRFGLPPMQYLAQVRAHSLAHLLAETDIPIGAAMNQVGWTSRGHAARKFTAIVGASPTEYRREAKSQAAHVSTGKVGLFGKQRRRTGDPDYGSRSSI